MVNEGDPVPDVKMLSVDGREISPTDYAAQKLVLYFYPKDDTSGCTAEAQAFTALAGEFEKANAWVLGVSKDDARKHGKFIEKYDLKVALATDADGSVCEAFGTWVEKSMYGRKYMGMERATFLIDGAGRVVKEWRKVKVPGHAEAVLAAVRGL